MKLVEVICDFKKKKMKEGAGCIREVESVVRQPARDLGSVSSACKGPCPGKNGSGSESAVPDSPP